ncbi:MAG: hypothetical protein AAF490_02870 [Chloroflexota bacterium]
MLDYPIKYAQFEYERRFLLSELPQDLDQNKEGRLIVDRYIKGSNLRLRKMATAVPNTFQYKFCKKIEPPDRSPLIRIITNIYLTQQEYQLFVNLPALPLTKVRYTFYQNGVRYSIDVFKNLNLILCEIEKPTLEELLALPTPQFAVAEVTNEPNYSGIFLAQKTAS